MHGFLSGESSTAREGFLTLLGGERGAVRRPALCHRRRGGVMLGERWDEGMRSWCFKRGAGGRDPLKRKPVKRDWTKAKEAKFIEQLAVTWNVTLAAKLSKVGNTTVYSRRRKGCGISRRMGRGAGKGLSGDRGRGHARYRGQFVVDRVRQLQAWVHDRERRHLCDLLRRRVEFWRGAG